MTEYRIVKQNFLKTSNIVVAAAALDDDERLIIQRVVYTPQYVEVAEVIEGEV